MFLGFNQSVTPVFPILLLLLPQVFMLFVVCGAVHARAQQMRKHIQHCGGCGAVCCRGSTAACARLLLIACIQKFACSVLKLNNCGDDMMRIAEWSAARITTKKLAGFPGFRCVGPKHDTRRCNGCSMRWSVL
jgi:hypothetical protein